MNYKTYKQLLLAESNRGSASRIHQLTALQKGVCLKNPLTYSLPKGVSASKIHQHQPKNGGFASRDTLYGLIGTSR